jgi:16S rRNA processing protein RimM
VSIDGGSKSAGPWVVGYVGRPVGLKGEVELDIASDNPARFEAGSCVFESGSKRAFTVRSVRRNRRGTVVAFAEITDRDQAEALRGTQLVVPRSDARELGLHEYWDHDLIGCEVVTADGASVGRVTDVLHAPANDVLVVRDGDREHLLPLIADVVQAVVPGSSITIDPIPGLLED